MKVYINTTCRELTFAGVDALDPRMIKSRVTDTSTIIEPRTTESATTALAGFLDGTALRTSGIGRRRRWHWGGSR